MAKREHRLTASHWGIGVAQVEAGKVVSVEGHPQDPAPSRLNENIAGSLHGEARLLRPAVRASWLAGQRDAVPRGADSFVEVSWDEALDLVASELTRVKRDHGNEGIFAGSYGWASAGRFHHAQSQLKRFLNTIGGFVRSEGNYSYNAALELMPHILMPFRAQVAQATRWSVIAQHCRHVVMFGGVALRNTQISDGGISRHRMADNFAACAANGVAFTNISPLRTDAMEALGATWMPVIPGTDTALMLGLAHTLLDEGLHDQAFLARFTTGFDKVAAYIRGETDEVAKDADWAAGITGVAAETIRQLARRMASERTMISVAAGVQRTDYGEQPMWMALTLAAMLGQIGLPGGGVTVGYGVNGNIGNIERLFRWGAMPQGRNPVQDFLPVAMISDMLLTPGSAYAYQGQSRRFPDARLVWWAGGNPFHHHQDLNRLHRAFQTPETIIVNEVNWTATARHADIVLPVAAAQERTDFGAGKSDDGLVPMPKLVEPPGLARVEYEIYADLAARMGTQSAFTGGRDVEGWLRHLWQDTRAAAQAHDIDLPEWDRFITGDPISIPDLSPNQVFLAAYRTDPDAHPLPTPSGRIELFSETLAGFDLGDCKGHAAWFPPRDRSASGAEAYPLALLSGQPETRLQSQLDNGAFSMSRKIAGREPVLIHPDDAASRGITSEDVVMLWNGRGRSLAGAQVTEDILPGCVFLWTGAWWDPDFTDPHMMDRHGNPNVLTHDLRTSSLGQSPASHSAMVQLAKLDRPAPAVLAHIRPQFVSRDAAKEKGK